MVPRPVLESEYEPERYTSERKETEPAVNMDQEEVHARDIVADPNPFGGQEEESPIKAAAFSKNKEDDYGEDDEKHKIE